MTTGKYGRRALLELCGGTEEAARAMLPWHVLKDDGLWLAPLEPGLTPAERDVMQWHAWGDSERPALSVPFTAHELAAFMLAGGGLSLFDAYDCGTEPDAEALLGLGQNAGKAREAYRVAHQLVLDANERFGRTDDGVRRAAQWLIDAARDDKPASVLQLDAQAQHLTAHQVDAPPKRHRIGRDVLAPVIDRCRAAVADSDDTAQVWAELERSARLPDGERPAPLAGVTSGGVRWHDGGTVNVLTRKALGDRLRRAR